MATVTPSRPTAPAYPYPEGVSSETVTIADTDDLNLSKGGAGERHRHLIVTASDVTTTLNSISNGDYFGQKLTLIVENITNALVVPAALGNVTAPANISVDDEAPKTLLWDGSAWRLASA